MVDWSSCRIAVENVDELYADCVDGGVVHPNSPLEATEYGTREFGIIDNHGVLIPFFERTAAFA
ncbi:MAG: hypothetical protein WD906_01065 [Anaerolineales bacterium]